VENRTRRTGEAPQPKKGEKHNESDAPTSDGQKDNATGRKKGESLPLTSGAGACDSPGPGVETRGQVYENKAGTDPLNLKDRPDRLKQGEHEKRER